MKKTFILLAAMLTATLAFTQTTATITGTLVDQSETATSSGVSLDVTLMNTNSQRCFVNGVGSLVKEKQTYTAAQVLAGITLAKTANITCGSSSGQTRWRFSFKNSALNTSRDCDLQITGNTSLNTATCLQAAATPPNTPVPTSSLFLLLDGSNSMTGNLVPAVNGTQSIGTSGSRWNMFANTMDASGNVSVGGTLGVTGLSTLANAILNGANTGSGAALTIGGTTTTTGGISVFVGASGAQNERFSVVPADGSTAAARVGALSVRTQSGGFLTGTEVAKIDSAGAFTGTATKLNGATSGTTTVQATAIAGTTTLTLPAATGTLTCNTCTQTLTATTITNLAITGGGTNRSLIFNGSAQVANGNTTDDGTNFSTGAVKLQVQGGVAQGSGLKHQRFGATTPTAAAAGATAITAYTWTSAFADANYTISCMGNTQANSPGGVSVESKAAAGFTIRVTSTAASAASFSGVDCIAIHD